MTLSFKCLVRNHQSPPSISINDREFLTHFQLYWRAEIWHISQESHFMVIHDIKDEPILSSTWSGTLNSLQVWISRTGVLDAFIFILERWKLAHKSRITFIGDPWHQGWPYPSSTCSGTINVLQVWTSRTGVILNILMSSLYVIVLMIVKKILYQKGFLYEYSHLIS